MTTKEGIDGGSTASFGRMSEIMAGRIREEQLVGVWGRVESRRLDGALTVHLREGLTLDPVHWVGYEGPRQHEGDLGLALPRVRKDVLERLAAVRTDLDSFSQIEAHALMSAGYLMIEAKADALRKAGWARDPMQGGRYSWDFLSLAHPIEDRDDRRHSRMMKLLGASRHRAWKIWRLEPLRSLVTLLPFVIFFLGVVLFGILRAWPGAWRAVGSV